MNQLGRVRRLYYREGLSLSEIERRTGLTRKTLRRWLKAAEGTEPRYRRRPAEDIKIAPFAAQLTQFLEVDARRAKRDRRSALKLFREIKATGFDGDYSRVTDFVRRWREQGGGPLVKAFVPLRFELGEAFQFDWSEEALVVGGIYRRLQVVAHEAVREPGVLAGGLPEPGPRDAVRCPHALASRRWAAFPGAASTTT